MSDSEDRINMLTERKLVTEAWSGATPEKLIEGMQELGELIGERSLSTIKWRVEALRKLDQLGLDGRLELGRDRRYNNFAHIIAQASNDVQNHISSVLRAYTDLIDKATELDIAESRLAGIVEQRRQLPPDVQLRLELSETSEITERDQANAEEQAIKQAEREAFDQVRCDETVSGEGRFARSSRCDKKFKAVHDGKKLCGIHTRVVIRRLQADIAYQTFGWSSIRKEREDHQARLTEKHLAEIAEKQAVVDDLERQLKEKK